MSLSLTGRSWPFLCWFLRNEKDLWEYRCKKLKCHFRKMRLSILWAVSYEFSCKVWILVSKPRRILCWIRKRREKREKIVKRVEKWRFVLFYDCLEKNKWFHVENTIFFKKIIIHSNLAFIRLSWLFEWQSQKLLQGPSDHTKAN